MQHSLSYSGRSGEKVDMAEEKALEDFCGANPANASEESEEPSCFFDSVIEQQHQQQHQQQQPPTAEATHEGNLNGTDQIF